MAGRAATQTGQRNKTVSTVDIENCTPLRNEDLVETENKIQMPTWLWTLIGSAVVGAVIHTVQLAVTVSRVDELTEVQKAHGETLNSVKDEQLKRTNPVYTVVDLKKELSSQRSLLEQIREDVIVLKTRDTLTHKEPMK